MSNIARLGAILSLDTKEFVKGVDAAQLKSKQFKQNLKETQQTLDGIKTAANATAIAMLAFGAIAAKTADEISDLADANETTVGKVLELKHALVASGGDAGKVSQLFSSFTNAVDDAAQGSDKLRDAFKAVGVSTKDLGLLSSDELRQKTIKGLAQVEDGITRNALGMQLFGKAAKGVDLVKLSQEAEKAAGHYDKQAEAIRSAADAAQKLELFFGDMKIAAISAMKPITALMNKIPTENRIEILTKSFTYLGEAIAIAFGVAAVKGVAKFTAALRVLYLTNPWLLAFSVAGGAAAYGITKYLESQSEETDTSKKPESNGGGGRTLEQSARDKMIEKYNAQIKIVKELAEQKQWAAQWDYANTIRQLNLEQEKYDLSTNQYERLKLANQLADKDAQLFKSHSEELRNARKELELAPAEEQAQAEKLYKVKVQTINDTYKIQQEYLNKENEARLRNFDAEVERQKSWAAGWKDAMKEYSEAAERASDRGRAAFQSVMSNMEAAIRKFVDTGKFSFSELTGSIIKDLMYMELRAQASSLFSMLFSSFKSAIAPSSGSAGSIFGDLFSGGVKQKASGGYLDSPAIVGENGAELFIPSTPGTIIPNGSWQQMAAAGSGGGMTINGPYIANMSAIDTQSGTAFLAKNKDTIWAAYQSANRSVPISR